MALGRREEALNLIRYAVQTAVFSSLAACLVVIGASSWLSTAVFHEPRMQNSLIVLAVAVPLSVLGVVFVTISRALKHVEYEALAKYFLESAARPVLAFALIVLGMAAFGISVAVTLAAGLSFLLAYYAVNFRILHLGFSFWLNPAKRPEGFYDFALPVYLYNVVGILVTYGAVFALGVLMTTSEVGLLNAAVAVASLAQVPAIAIPVLFGTVAVELNAKKERKSLERLYKNVTKAIVMFTLPLSVLLAAYPVQVIQVLRVGAEYTASAFPLAALSIGFLVFASCSTAIYMLFLLKKTRNHLLNSLLSAGVLFVGLYLAIPTMGLNGAALANAFAIASQGLFPLLTVYYFSGLHPFSKAFVMTVLAGILAGVLTYVMTSFVAMTPIFSMIAASAVFLVLYGALLFLLRAFDESDVELFKAVELRTGVKLGFVRGLLKKYYFGS
jgi:O-antigen/teichoic acid export membrane protein